MSMSTETMKSMIQYAIHTLHTVSGSRKNTLRGIVKADYGYRIHMASLSPFFDYTEAKELIGQTVEMEGIEYRIDINSSLWFQLTTVV